MTLPLLSIITPTFNAGVTLAETLRSLEGQLDERTEHLLVDACSEDNTLEIARRAGWVKVSSEPDRGIYDGMNKGAAMACGEWLLFLQADDWLPAGCLDAYRAAIARHADADIICGSAESVELACGAWRTVWRVEGSDFKSLTVRNIALGEPMINARLIRRLAFQKLGGFDGAYSLASDRDFLLRAVREGLHQAVISEDTYRYRWHAGSSTMTYGNDLSERLSRENSGIAASHLRRAHGDDAAALRKWHSRIMVQRAVNHLEQGEMRSLMARCMEASGVNPLWIGALAKEIVCCLPGFLARGGKTRSGLRAVGQETEQ